MVRITTINAETAEHAENYVLFSAFSASSALIVIQFDRLRASRRT